MSLDKLKKEIKKKYEQDLMVKGSTIKDVERWPTGSLALDFELGGGYPIGRITTVLGEYSDGKTSLVLKGVAEYQKKYADRDILWVDVEGAWDREWAITLGVDADEVWVVQPEYQQQAFDIINKAIEYNVGLVVVDSVAALVPKEEAEASFEKWNIGLAARINSKAMRGFQSTLNTKAAEQVEIPPSIILINQLREKIDSSPYKSTYEPGGKAIGFHSAVKIYLRRGDLFPKPASNYDMSVVPKAQQIKFHVEKNKTAPPRKRGWTWFYFDTLDTYRCKGSIDHIEELVRYCRDYQVLDEYAKGRFNFTNPDTGEIERIHGINTFATMIRQHPKLVPSLKDELMKRVKASYESTEKPQVDASVEPVSDEEQGEDSSKEISSLPDSWFGEHSMGEAGHGIGDVLDSAQANGQEIPQSGLTGVESSQV